MDPATLTRVNNDERQLAVAFQGQWTIDAVCAIEKDLDDTLADALRRNAHHVAIDTGQIAQMDTSGAWMLYRLRSDLIAQGVAVDFVNVQPSQRILIDEVATYYQPCGDQEIKPAKVSDGLEEVGETVVATAHDLYTWASAFGAIISALVRSFLDWRIIRPHSVVTQMEHAGLRAVPIVSLMSLLIGGVIAQQGAYQLRLFGADVFTVDLVGILVLREIGVLLTSIMVAGRSGSAFTAEIGSMQMREEVDALKIIGLKPIDVLVLPRLIALVIVLPLLTIISNVMCILGAMMVTWVYLDVSPAIFLQRLHDAIDMEILTVGLIKAPFMAVIIALVACIEGLRVRGSAESLGQRVTASVVKAIFMVIVIDAFFAVFFAAIDY